MSAREKKLVYHLTALENLASILSTGLRSRRDLSSATEQFTDIADADILTGRASHELDLYVPFHFITRNPFDYAVVRNQLGSQFALIAVSRSVAQANDWKIIPRHPLTNAGKPELLSWDAGLAAITWSEMDKEPRNYEADHDCKMVCMAEALSPMTVPATLFQSIFVPNAESEALVRQMVANAGCSLYVNVNARMFPGGAR